MRPYWKSNWERFFCWAFLMGLILGGVSLVCWTIFNAPEVVIGALVLNVGFRMLKAYMES